MAIPMKIKCLPEPQLQFSNGCRDLDPRRARSANRPVDHRGWRTIRVGVGGLVEDDTAARGWIAGLGAFKGAGERNARRFRDWPGAERALGGKLEIDEAFVRRIDQSQFDWMFRYRISGRDFDTLVELFENPVTSMFGDVRPDCIVVCIPDALGDLRVQNPELTAKERRALEILKREEENEQGDLFAPSPEELAEAEALRTTAEDLLFRAFYRALKAQVHKYENAVPIQSLRRRAIGLAEAPHASWLRKADRGHTETRGRAPDLDVPARRGGRVPRRREGHRAGLRSHLAQANPVQAGEKRLGRALARYPLRDRKRVIPLHQRLCALVGRVPWCPYPSTSSNRIGRPDRY